MTQTLWITGVTGFTGRHVAELVGRAVPRPRIVGVDVASPGRRPPLDRFRRMDLTQPTEVERLAREDPPQLILHLAGRTPPGPEDDLWRANVAATHGLLLGVAAAGCRDVRVLGIGSAAEYDLEVATELTERSPVKPATAYGRTKLAQTLLTLALGRALGLCCIVARPFNLIGPGLPTHLMVGRLCHEFNRVGPHDRIVMGNLETSRDLVDVRDAADAYWRLLADGRPGEIYNVCSGTPVSTTSLIELLCALTGKRPTIHATERAPRAMDPPVVYGSNRKLRRRTAWTPRISLQRSIEDMLAALSR